MSAEYVTRREFDALDRQVTGIADRVAWLDEHGTRGVEGVRAAQLDTSAKLAKLEASMEQHERAHVADAKDRANARRWTIASVVIPTAAVIAAAVGSIALLLHH